MQRVDEASQGEQKGQSKGVMKLWKESRETRRERRKRSMVENAERNLGNIAGMIVCRRKVACR